MTDMAGLLIWAVLAAPATWIGLALAARIAPQDFQMAQMREQAPGAVPVRQLGGLVIIPLYLAGLAVAARFHPDAGAFLAALGGATALLWVVGIIDDHNHLPSGLRLATHLLAGIAVAFAIDPAAMFSGGLLAWWVERLGIAIGLVCFVNMTNFMDGMDLMTVAGLGMPLAACVFLLANGPQIEPVAFATLVATAALLGFALFNRPVARLYLGDSGSLPLGLVAGTACAGLAFKTGLVPAILPFGYYLFDSGSTLALRAWRRQNLFSAHSGHAYQVARKAGRSEWWVIRRVVAANLALAIIAWFSVNATTMEQTVLAAVCGVLVAAGVVVHFRWQAPVGNSA